jgi:hypothetical protein
MRGRPVDPNSEASLKPWKALGVSKATFYWKKRAGWWVELAAEYGADATYSVARQPELKRLLMRSPHKWWALFAAEYGVDLVER